MRRKIHASMFPKMLYYTRYLFPIMFSIENWMLFVLNYVGLKNNSCIYTFRNGTKIKVDGNINTATIAVVFIKRDYGKVDNGSVVIDIGANIGTYSLLAAESKDVKVYAFEPMVDNFKLLQENILLNKRENSIFPFNLAVGSTTEERSLYLSGSPFHSLYPAQDFPFDALHGEGNVAGQKHESISCISLKDVFEKNNIRRCDILKLDCEGAEFEILYNLPRECFAKIRKIRLEYHNHKTNPEFNGKKLVEFLNGNGFVVEKIKESSPDSGDVWLVNSGNNRQQAPINT